ncbi:MAG: glycogen-binding domain-containing protein [Fibrobacterota bacterium]
MAKASKTAKRKRVAFTYDGKPGRRVFVAGTFNDWNPGEKELKDRTGGGDYSLNVLLTKERHLYKFVVDGEWINDPQCDQYDEDGFGGVNSVIDLSGLK